MTKNCNLDEEGYIKLSPRSVIIADQAANADFGVPVAIGRLSDGQYLVATSSDANFNVTTSRTTLEADENSGANEPTLTTASHGIFFKGLWHATSAVGLFHRAASDDHTAAWTAASGFSAITSGKVHRMAVFASRQSICVTNGNTVVQYTESGGTYTASNTLTIPSDYEAVGLAYNNAQLGIITRLGTSSVGQNAESVFFIWDGATTSANNGFTIGSDATIAICAYKSSFVILTRTGQLLYFNGGGFEIIASFPFFFQDKIWQGQVANDMIGDCMVADGDVIYLNLGLQLNTFGRKWELLLPNCPSGVWCFDPKVGLYHRWSPSISHAYLNNVTDSNVNVTTDLFTITSGTIPATGKIARVTSIGTVTGISLNQDYYIIKVSSTTFKLATTKANALAGTVIDLTGTPSGTTTFWMYDLVDFSNTYHDNSGAIALTAETNTTYQDVVFGGDYENTSLAANDAMCMVVPLLENRGYFVTPKISSSQIKDHNQKLFVKFRPLKTDDKIIVKYRDRDIVGLPVTSSKTGTIAGEANWTSPSGFYTLRDISEAKTYLDAGGELECEFVSGAGGGVMVKVTSISASDGTNASVVLAEEVLGASSTLKSEFIIHNWEVLRTITNSDADHAEGVAKIPIGGASKFIQLKIELRGSDTTVEELGFINATAQ